MPLTPWLVFLGNLCLKYVIEYTDKLIIRNWILLFWKSKPLATLMTFHSISQEVPRGGAGVQSFRWLYKHTQVFSGVVERWGVNWFLKFNTWNDQYYLFVKINPASLKTELSTLRTTWLHPLIPHFHPTFQWHFVPVQVRGEDNGSYPRNTFYKDTVKHLNDLIYLVSKHKLTEQWEKISLHYYHY